MADTVSDRAAPLAASLASAIAGKLADAGATDSSALGAVVAEAIAAEPTLRHAVNAEPWYRSRVTWGAIVAAATPLIGLLVGHEIGVEERSLIVDIAMAGGSIAGAALALHGRWIARRPIGQ